MTFSNEITQLIKEYTKLTNYIFNESQSTDKTLIFKTPNNKIVRKTPNQLKTDIIYKTTNNKKTINLTFNIKPQPKQKQKIRIVSFGINKDNYDLIKNIANKNNMSLNELYKEITNQIIKNNK